MSGIGTAAMAAAPAVLSSVGTGLFGWIGAKKSRQFAKEAATTAHQRDIEMWQRANAYNTPAQQMQRLKAAGLNPNLVYGNGSVTGNTSTATPKHQSYEQPVHTVQMPDLMNVISQYQTIKGQKLSNDAQSIQNLYMEGKQLAELGSKEIKYLRELTESGAQRSKGGHYLDVDKSTHLKQFQEQIKGKELDNALKKINVDFFKKIPKEYQFLVPLLMRLIR